MGESGWPTPPQAEAWYEVIGDGTMRQGDIYRDVELFRLGDSLRTTTAIDSVPVAKSEGTIILLSPSCDLEQDRVQTGVLVARIWAATEEHLGASKRSDYRKRLELLRQDGYAPRFLLPAFDGIEPPFPWSFVDWRQPYFLPKPYLRSLAEMERLRLRHPFREKLGIWAGQRLSEVGIEKKDSFDRFISIGGAGDVLEAREAHGAMPLPEESEARGSADEP